MCLSECMSIILHNLYVCVIFQPGPRTHVAQRMQPKPLLLSCCLPSKHNTCHGNKKCSAYSWCRTQHQSLWVLQIRKCSPCALIFTTRNTHLVVVVVGISLISRFCRLRCLLAGWFSIHDDQTRFFM